MRENWIVFALAFVVALLAGLALRPAPDAPAREPMPRPAPEPAPAPEKKGLLVDLGNAHCPVMDGETDGETYAEWNHLRVGFCCKGCDTRFLADPEAHLDKAAPDWREAAQAIAAYLEAGPEHKDHRLAAIRARWTIVREPEGE